MKKKTVLKSMARFKVIVKETLLNNLPPVVLFDLYELNEEQINYLYQRVNEIYNTDTNKDEELDSFYIPEKKRRLTGYNLNFLFQKLDEAKKTMSEQEYENIREEIITRNITLVKSSIKFLFKDIPLPKEDTMMFGVEGLLDAIDSYQGKSQATFYSYAISKIVLNIQNHFKELIGITYEEYKQGENNLIIPASKLITEESTIISSNQIDQEENQIGQEDEYITEDNQMPVSFEDYDEVDTLEDEELNDYGTEEFNYDNIELRELVNQSFDTIPDTESRAIKLYYDFTENGPMTYKQIAEIENRSITLIQDRVRKGIYRLSHTARKSIIKDYNVNDYSYTTMQQKKAKQIEQQTIMYTRICELLFYNISARAFQNFMRMVGFELTPDEIVKLVNDINKICSVASEGLSDWTWLCKESKNIIGNDKIREKVCQIICQSSMYSNLIRVGIRQFYDNIYQLYENSGNHEEAEKIRLQLKKEREGELQRVSYYPRNHI